jgi:hypothetical protein
LSAAISSTVLVFPLEILCEIAPVVLAGLVNYITAIAVNLWLITPLQLPWGLVNYTAAIAVAIVN